MIHSLSIKKIMLKVTNLCNLQCKYCIQGTNKEQYNDFSLNVDVIEYIKSLKRNNDELSVIQFEGGETLIKFNDIKFIVEQLKNFDLRFVIITNGKLLNEDIIKFCNNNGINIVLSWDGRSSELYRGYDVFKDKYHDLLKLEYLKINSMLTNESIILDKFIYLKDFHKQYIKIHGMPYLKFDLRILRNVGDYYNEIIYNKLSNELDILCSGTLNSCYQLYYPFAKLFKFNSGVFSLRYDGYFLTRIHEHNKLPYTIYNDNEFFEKKDIQGVIPRSDLLKCSVCKISDYCHMMNIIDVKDDNMFCKLQNILYSKLSTYTKGWTFKHEFGW